jgi:RNA polymerase sigma factor (sigma-70 family)
MGPMPQRWSTEDFEEHRSHLRGVAYRMLGSLSEADDAVQEAWLRLERTDSDQIENLGAWLTTVVSRICLNLLRSRTTRREEPFEGRLPDPIVRSLDDTGPEHDAVMADSVGLALLVVLETLSPAERVAFVLHDVFALPFEEIAVMLDRTPAAARQLASRARRRVQSATTEPDADAVEQRALSFANPRTTVHPVLVNGAVGVISSIGGRPVAVLAFTVRGGRVVAIDGLSDPARLALLDLPSLS